MYLNFEQPPPLSLYIHFPWCIRKCPYCDFNSHRQSGEIPEDAYIERLLGDLDADSPWVQERPLQSIFMGGGTPSLFSPSAIARLLQGIEQRIPFSSTIEITLEANPGTLEQHKFSGFYTGGVNRLSIGIQSFQDPLLKRLGRVHNGDEARRAIESARSAGFENFNLDLMHGLPGQTLEMAVTDLECALGFEPTHLSWYQLTIEPRTEFYKHPPLLPNEDVCWSIYEQGSRLLNNQNFTQYEVSAFARSGQESRHNMNYWQFGDYLGIGAGAHGKISVLANQQVLRSRKTRSPLDYLKKPVTELCRTELIDPNALPGEFMLNALRLHRGFAIELFEQRTGMSISTIAKLLCTTREAGLLETDTPIRATAQGRLFLNDLLSYFIS